MTEQLCKCGKKLHHIGACKGTNHGACKGSIPWNKGLTKKTDERVRNYGLKLLQPRTPFTCPTCGKTILVTSREKRTKKHCSKECYKLDLKNKRVQFTCPVCNKVMFIPPKLAKVRKTCSRRCAHVKNRLEPGNSKKHYKLILEQTKILEEQGFRCFPITKVVPDIIAVKGQNIQMYAVEVEANNLNPNYNKYTDDVKHYVNDVYWIILKTKTIKK